jgi:hypothetical protein
MDQPNNEFNSDEHLKPAIKAAVYYLFIYIPILLPISIWKEAAVSLTNIWQSRSISFNSRTGKYPLWSLFYKYVVTFVFDASILLAWPILIYQFIFEWSGFSMIGNMFEYMSFSAAIKTIISGGLAMYGSVIGIRLAKETLKFVLDNLVTWMLNVLHSIGQMLVNVWKFNVVIRRKEG